MYKYYEDKNLTVPETHQFWFWLGAYPVVKYPGNFELMDIHVNTSELLKRPMYIEVTQTSSDGKNYTAILETFAEDKWDIIGENCLLSKHGLALTIIDHAQNVTDRYIDNYHDDLWRGGLKTADCYAKTNEPKSKYDRKIRHGVKKRKDPKSIAKRTR